MYDELVMRLREAPNDWPDAELHYEAANAIEELSAAIEGYESSTNMALVEKDGETVIEFRQKWIPVEERIPQETQRCIVVSKCGEMAFAIYKGNGFQYPHYMGKATHWMPLLQPPTAEEGE